MKKTWLIVLGAIVLLILAGVGMYNRLVSLQTGVDAAWSQVENVLQRRADLIPNLVSSVKGYVKHERTVLDNLAKARTAYAGATNTNDKIRAAGEMETAISRLLVIVENYPNLKANETFARLMDELAGSENRIAVERKRYNDTVQQYNVTLRRVPFNIFAGWFKFAPKPFFQAQEQAKQVPQVSFE